MQLIPFSFLLKTTDVLEKEAVMTEARFLLPTACPNNSGACFENAPQPFCPGSPMNVPAQPCSEPPHMVPQNFICLFFLLFVSPWFQLPLLSSFLPIRSSFDPLSPSRSYFF